MKKKFVIISLVALFVVGVISVAFSQGYGRRGKSGSGVANWEKTELNLTKEQLEEIQPLRANLDEETLQLRNEMQIKALEYQQLWTADELDEEAIVAKSKEISDLKDQLQEKMIRHRLDIAKVLTKEQRASFAQTGRFGRGRGSMHGGGGYGRGQMHGGRGSRYSQMHGRGGFGPGFGAWQQGHRW